MVKKQSKAVTPSREDITAKLYPGLTFETDDLPVMTDEEIERRLSRFGRENVYDQFGQPKRSSAIQSIDILVRKRQGIPSGLNDNRTINIYIAGGEQDKENLRLLLAGQLRPGVPVITEVSEPRDKEE